MAGSTQTTQNEQLAASGKAPVQRALFGMTLKQLTALVDGLRQPLFRAKQLHDALYRQRVESIDDISTFPVAVREKLKADGWSVGLPQVALVAKSVDGTERYLVKLGDGETVETVWMPGGDGGEQGDGTPAAEEEEAAAPPMDEYKRGTICISSQVGCAVNCQFCLTGKLGLRRNLTAGEIAGQVAVVLNRQGMQIGKDRINLVFMGQGEPFHNFDNFMDSVRLLVGPMGIPESRMTVSTSGILHGIDRYMQEPVRPKLAISLNGSNDKVRTAVMPINKKWPIGVLLNVIRQIPLRPRERLTFEYVLLGGVNDSVENAREVVQLLRGLRAKVNLIIWNPGPYMPFEQPDDERVAAFQQTLREGGLPAYIRRPRGRDIYAACGQLKRTMDDERLVTIH
ncbi:23S rRNA (adenine(2503)-C(2))-methyltransferase RlmN [Terriglobus albidus]|uniref:23S rRNA (adenine(2503)-C(2))-methyltransferase RlmN n=1 Tax=Terriglobus albidus TaxID=1592106 RepID=UPI0021DFD8BA|nr:23S rRNA (adenine(2503)-C(2))-methyltransferase RlmN [Terriglobus albidus]